MPILLTCPGCRQQMTIADENHGATVRCPACRTTFSSLQDRGSPSNYSAGPAGVPPVPSMGPGYVEVASDKADMARRSGEPTGIGRDVRWDDGDPMSIRREPQKSTPLFLAFVIGGFTLLAVAVVLVASLVLSNRDGDNAVVQQGPHDLLSLAPADSIFLFGITVVRGEKAPIQLEQARQQLLQKGAPAVLGDLLVDAERFIVAGEYSKEMPTAFIALLTKTPYDREKLKKDLDLGPARTVQDATIYTLKVHDVNVPIKEMYFAMPEPRVLVVGIMPEAEFVKALANQGKPAVIHDDLQERAREMESAKTWLLLANRGMLRKKVLEVKAKEIPWIGLMFPEEIAALQRCKTLSFIMRTVNKEKDNRFELSLECGDGADATKLHKFADTWKGLLTGKEAPDPALGPLFKDLTRSLKVELKGLIVTCSVELRAATTDQLAEKLQGFKDLPQLQPPPPQKIRKKKK